MKRGLYTLLALVLVLLAYGLLAGVSPGYVLIYVGGYSFETTVVALVLAVVVLVLLVKALLWLARTFNPLRLRNVRGLRRLFGPLDPQVATREGLNELLLGNWQQAWRLLTDSADKVQNPALNQLAASLAAFQLGDKSGWIRCLEQAEKQAPALAQGLLSLRAWYEARSGERSQALLHLHGLQRSKPNQPFVLQQMADIYRAVGDWTSLEQMLPDLERRRVLTGDALQALQDEVYPHQLQMAARHGEASLQKYWGQVPKALRSRPLITAAYIRELLTVGNDAEAAGLLQAFLKKQWSDDVVALVGQLNAGQPQQQLTLLENCLRQHPENPVLLLTLGRVAVRCQLWGRAREYFDKALKVATASPQKARICTELAKLHEQLGEREKALHYHQQAMQWVSKSS